MKIKVLKINLLEVDDLEPVLQQVCELHAGEGFKLISAFESGGELILIFQKD